MEKQRTILIQNGARHRYFLPRLLEREGLLAAFYTDAHAKSLLGKVATIVPSRFRTAALRRLINRTITDIPPERIHAFDARILIEAAVKPLKEIDYELWYLMRDFFFYALINQRSVSPGSVIFSMSAENLRYLEQAKKRGHKVIVDAFISPVSLRIMANEKDKGGLAKTVEEENYVFMERIYSRIYDSTDLILCPSQWVADGVIQISPANAEKIRICPYGSSIRQDSAASERIAGRIFWAGGEWLRKGLHYLAEAVAEIKSRHPSLEVRVAGIARQDVEGVSNPSWAKFLEGLTYLGKLDTRAMIEEFRSCEMFVLPSLTEGMASVVIEALAMGCPVIVTKEVGIDGIQNGYNGLVVPSRDSRSLATAIESLHVDSRLRQALVEQAAEITRSYSNQAWGERLRAAVESV